ncbi:MAG: hypothetical protein CMQ30_08445 [Gammaproteobacteria bacterium]|nr:hypothetical protein [Gammaproteobacteria bacterium]
MSEEDLESSHQHRKKVPGRTIGFSVMSAIIFFVSIWMVIQGNNEASPDLSNPSSFENFGDSLSVELRLPNAPLLGFVEVEASEFVMGSNPALDRLAYENERWSSRQRQGEVYLPSFYISRYETTIAQFGVYAEEVGLDLEQIELAGSPDFAAHNITWSDAVGYAGWLDSKLRSSPSTPEKLKTILDGGGRVTLPSEAEWEKAARGTDGRIFPWGSQPTSDFANFNTGEIHSVGSKSCSECAYGLADMAGNVWEFTRSPLQDYPYDPEDDLENLSEDALWVMRGGSFADSINNVRTAVRGAVDPGVRSSTIGFRVAISTAQ